MKVPESVLLVWELFVFVFGIAALFAWAAWQDGSAWALRRLGFAHIANRREAVADAAFREVIGWDVRD